jgi:kumamolisin
MASPGRTTIDGSRREFFSGHERVEAVDEQEVVTVTVYLRDRGSATPSDSQELGHLSREKWADAHGSDPEDVAAVRAFAQAHGLTVEDEDPDDRARRRIRLTGPLEALRSAFGVEEMAVFKRPDGTTYRGRRGELSVPEGLAGTIVGVFGIDNRPQAKPHMRMAPAAAGSGFTPMEVAQAYNFPTEAAGQQLDGSGETVAIIELGGGYRTEELDRYFTDLGVPAPSTTAVNVDGGSNSPGSPADGEVMLDIEVVGAIVPAASIVVYFAPNNGDQGFIDAVSKAVHDSEHKPSVVSISWGGPEDHWTDQGRTQMEQVLTEAAELGVTVTVAAGDGGSTDGVTEEEPLRQHVDFPASAPHALACGGTSLVTDGHAIAKEAVWNDEPGGGATGGGVSVEFPRPTYQEQAHVEVDNHDTGKPGRGVPDVAGDADPRTGYRVLVDGRTEPVGGTSAVAPLWAALVTRINQAHGVSSGFLQPRLYAMSAGVFNDITAGDNGVYEARKGWDACTGLGSPNGDALLKALEQSSAGS